MSNFAFLAAEFPTVHEAAVEAERQAGVSPTAAAFFAGKTVEVAVKWALRQVGEADFARFKQKARHFLKAHEDQIYRCLSK
jgi:hypothetical protein